MNITPLDLNYSYPSEGVGVLIIKNKDAVSIHASSMYLSVGNCQEHSIHTTFIHS